MFSTQTSYCSLVTEWYFKYTIMHLVFTPLKACFILSSRFGSHLSVINNNCCKLHCIWQLNRIQPDCTVELVGGYRRWAFTSNYDLNIITCQEPVPFLFPCVSGTAVHMYVNISVKHTMLVNYCGQMCHLGFLSLKNLDTNNLAQNFITNNSIQFLFLLFWILQFKGDDKVKQQSAAIVSC